MKFVLFSSRAVKILFVLNLLGSHHFVTFARTNDSAEDTAIGILINDLLSGYNEHAVPVSKSSDPLELVPFVSLLQIINLDGRDQTLTFSASIGFGWYDAFLSWNSSEYGNLTFVTLPADSIWVPDIGLMNSVDENLYVLTENTKSRVQLVKQIYGTVTIWKRQRVYTVSCEVDMTYFPFDQHVCDIMLVSATLPLSNLVMLSYSSKISLDDYKSSTEWDVITTWAATEELKPLKALSWAKLDASALYRASIVLRRRSGYYVVHLILPCVFMSLLVVLAFFMPCEAGEKVSFSVTILLAFTVYQMIVADTLPKSSDTTPILSIYLTIQIAMSCLSVVASMLVLNVHHHDPQKPVPNWMKTLVYGCLAFVTFKRHAVRELRLKKKVTKIQVEPSDTFSKDMDSELHSTLDRFRKASALPEEIPSPAATQPGQSDYEQCWKVAAAILDRFFLFVFLVVIVLTSVALLVAMPHTSIGNYLNINSSKK